MNDVQEETDDMEWEEMGREEKLERVKRNKEGWEVIRFAKNIVLELGEKAVSWTENKHIRDLLKDIVHEGWKRMKTEKVLRMITNSEKDIQNMIIEYCVQIRADEESLLAALRLEEEKQNRLESIKTDPW